MTSLTVGVHERVRVVDDVPSGGGAAVGETSHGGRSVRLVMTVVQVGMQRCFAVWALV